MSTLKDMLERNSCQYTPSAETDDAIFRAAHQAIAHRIWLAQARAGLVQAFRNPLGVGIGAFATAAALFAFVTMVHTPPAPSRTGDVVPAEASHDAPVSAPSESRRTEIVMTADSLDRDAQIQLVSLFDSISPCYRAAPAQVAFDDKTGRREGAHARKTAVEAFLRGAARKDCPRPVLVDPAKPHDWTLVLEPAESTRP